MRFFGFLFILLGSNYLYAATDLPIEALRQEIQKQDKSQSQLLAKPRHSSRVSSEDISNPVVKLPPAGGQCFSIKTTRLVKQPQSLISPPMFQRLNGHCADVRALSQLLSDINIFYKNKGLITTRAYFPKQNLKSGNLTLDIRAGVLEKIEYANSLPIDGRISSAFPLDQGSIINLRQLEQGLDNFNKPPSQQGQFKLYPGTEPHKTIVKINTKQEKPWRFKTTLNNSGYDSTGKRKASADLSFDNVIDSNDTLSFGYNRNIDTDNHTKYSKSMSMQWVVPVNNKEWDVSYSQHQFKRVLPGINQNYVVDGKSEVVQAGISTLINRDQRKRIYAYAKVGYKDSKNFIENNEIKTQRRRLTTAKAGMRGDIALINKSTVDWDVGIKTGTSWFGAMDEIPGDAEADFEALTISTQYKQPLQAGGYTLTSTVNAQLTSNELPGSEQFGVGGRYDVRGFHDDTLFGNSGVFLRNTLEKKQWKDGQLSFQPYVGVDAGWIKASKAAEWDKSRVVGVAAGAKIKIGKHITSEATYSKALDRPSDFRASKDQLYWTTTVKF